MESELVVGEPAILASCLSFARWDMAPCGLVVFLEPMKAVVNRNTILTLDSGCKGWGAPITTNYNNVGGFTLADGGDGQFDGTTLDPVAAA